VEELELLGWRHEEEVAGLVQQKLWERVSSCNLTDCYLRDPVLRAFSDMPTRFREGYAMLLLTDGQWSATQESEAIWRVEARVGDSEPTVFIANSMYRTIVGWVEPSTD
jgi:hypothetical protein